MLTTRILARAIALLMLLVSVSAWAITQQEVLTAIQNKDPAAHEKLAAYAAENNQAVSYVVGQMVNANPRMAGAIVAAGVSANPSNAGKITQIALMALRQAPGLSESERRALQTAVIKNAAANAPADQVASIRQQAIRAGIDPAAVDAAIASGEGLRSSTATASLVSSLTNLTMNTSTTYAGGGGVASP